MGFDELARGWDTERRIERAKIIGREVLGAIGSAPHGAALDFGCGTGLISFNLHDHFSSIELVDTSVGMIDALNAKISSTGLSHMRGVVADLPGTDALPGPFDVIYSSMVLHHIVDVDTTLASLVRRLAPGGLLCIIELVEDDGSFHSDEKDFKGHNGFAPSWMESTLGDLGLIRINSRIFYNASRMVGETAVDYALFITTGQKAPPDPTGSTPPPRSHAGRKPGDSR